MEQVLIDSLLALAVAAFTALLSYGAKYLAAKSKNALLDRAIFGLEHAVVTAVKEVHQVYVDGLKKGREDGKLTDEEKEAALEAAIAKAKKLLGMDGLALLWKAFGDSTEEVLASKIEATVKDLKDSAPRP